MTNNRRDFLKKAALLTGALSLSGMLPEAIQRAMAISADPGTTFLDAEHIVFLMQENRSFDHLFGSLNGVRGFNDPRVHRQPNGNKVWLQEDKDRKTYPPFRLDLHQTKVTWQGGLPHSWKDQVAARNAGKYDKWVPVKTLMSMGYYTRADIPFYYALADAFTICDQHFCSSLTGTTPNRLFFWTGKNRAEQHPDSVAVVDNHQAESHSNTFVDWETFPELLEKHQVSWKIYQNEVWTAKIKDERVGDWVDNYGDNAIEYIKRHNVKLSAYFRKNGDNTLEPSLSPEEVQARYNALSEFERNLIDKAFTTNINAPEDYLALEPYTFTNDKGQEETVDLPKGDVFWQFRKDVEEDKLPAVSWLVAPQRFSDHTDTPLYGTWYVSEALNILTKNPEIWKKTIFILNYDENDGYFEHIPPFVVPNPGDDSTGKVSKGIDSSAEYIAKDSSPIGLGYRVPMIIASPWSKGGFVNSEVCDHTSCLMFLEKFLSHKTGKTIQTESISPWRRAICGDLTSAFRPHSGAMPKGPEGEGRSKVVQHIQNAANKPLQPLPAALSEEDIRLINEHESHSLNYPGQMPRQEEGRRKACALPYDLIADAVFIPVAKVLRMEFKANPAGFGSTSHLKGAGFNLISKTAYRGEVGKVLAYAVAAGESLKQDLPLFYFENREYDLQLNGPNGFYREWKGSDQDPNVSISLRNVATEKAGAQVLLVMKNLSKRSTTLIIENSSYVNTPPERIELKSGKSFSQIKTLNNSDGWYDLLIKVEDSPKFARRFAGHVETGKDSFTDPLLSLQQA